MCGVKLVVKEKKKKKKFICEYMAMNEPFRIDLFMEACRK